ncbi:hypothetical protein [Paenibacillus hamazuiensis]|uniref:hypothetical protein n=1 Tax=Paenibacillus hamazuiensis TaxID=2936508 RepID=UPI00200BDD6A|nr:hypothetical protein [Paenibacillus hamazuiensis]
MKRYLLLLFTVLMAFSIAACSSSPGGQAAGEAPKAAQPTASPKPTAPAIAASPSPDAGKSAGAAAQSPQPESKPSPSPSPEPGDKAAAGQSGESKPSPAPEQAKPQSAPPADTKPSPAPEPEKKAEPTPQPEAAKPSPQPEAKPAPAPQTDAKPAPASAPKEQISPKGKKLLLVGRENAPDDVVVSARMKALGFAVTMMIDRELTADATKGYDLIYISQTTNSKMLKGGVMKDVAIPTVYVKNHGMFYLGLSSVEENTNVMNVKSIDIVDPGHEVAGGLSGSVDIYKETNSKIGISYGIPGKEAKVIATAPGDKEKAAIYYYDKGTKADNGYAVKARISFFFLNNGLQENTTDEGWKLLDNLVVWTLQNG